MNILFLTIGRFNNINERGIYTDLVRELTKNNINVYVVTPSQSRENKPTWMDEFNKVSILHVRTGNITKTKSLLEKGLSTLRIESQFLKTINEYFSDVKFDMILYSTPPITFNKIIKYFKKKQGSKSYLILKDIFPQNSVDLDILKKNGIIYNYFRKKEKELYQCSDTIGCMSPANMEYILNNNSTISSEKVEIFPNAIAPIKLSTQAKDVKLLNKYKISEKDTIFLYGGNLGRPQGIDFLIKVANDFSKMKDSHLLIIGDGTEFEKISQYIEHNKLKNVSIHRRLPKKEYDQLMQCADVGLIFLDPRFTIPNFPSRLTSYMENAIPVIAATDIHTDIKDVLLDANCGFWCESGDLNKFKEYTDKLSNDRKLREAMGRNGRKYLDENYDVSKTIDILLKHLEGE